MRVREATQADHDAVIELMQLLNTEDPKLPKDVSHQVFTQILNSNNFVITIAEIDAKLIGSCYINIIPNLTRSAAPYAVIENVVTHPAHRRMGVGRALIANALQHAKSNGCYKVMLLTGGDLGVQQFYKSCGLRSDTKTAFIKRWEC